jgi:uncharacterized membrane protein YbhN (UPF0104 family)
VFLVAAVGFALWRFGPESADVGEDMLHASPLAMLLALVFTFIGLIAFGLMWLRVVRGYGYTIGWRRGLGIFFIGQLGRYILGSVWSFGAQATMARDVGIPFRTTLTAGLVGLGISLASSGFVGGLVVAFGLLPIPVPGFVGIIVAVVALAAMSPWVINFFGTRFAGKTAILRFGIRDIAVILLLMIVTWVAYGLSLIFVSTGVGTPTTGWFDSVGTATGAYALAYIVGVVIVFAPAGLGAREAALTVLLVPLFSLESAAAVAVLARIPTTIADFTLALVAWLLARRDHAVTQPVSRFAPTAHAVSAPAAARASATPDAAPSD